MPHSFELLKNLIIQMKVTFFSIPYIKLYQNKFLFLNKLKYQISIYFITNLNLTFLKLLKVIWLN